jgi:hypothetical protein
MVFQFDFDLFGVFLCFLGCSLLMFFHRTVLLLSSISLHPFLQGMMINFPDLDHPKAEGQPLSQPKTKMPPWV